jgi:hypothetical protein
MAFGLKSIDRARHFWWRVLVVILLAAQFGVGLHQIEHRLKPDVVADDTCVVCQSAANMHAGPEPVTFVPPVAALIDRVQPFSAISPEQPFRLSGFRPRGPPRSTSA